MGIRKVPVTREKITVETVSQEFHLTLSEREFALVYYLVVNSAGPASSSLCSKLAEQSDFHYNKQPELNHVRQNCPAILLSDGTQSFLSSLSNEVNE